MISNPDGVKPEFLRQFRAAQHEVEIGVSPEVREEKSKFHSHLSTTCFPCPGIPTTAPSAYTSVPRTIVRTTAPVTDRP